MKKIIIIVLILLVATGVTLYLIPWGGAESEVSKTEISNDKAEGETGKPDFNKLEGTYKAKTSEGDEKITSEIMFNVDALQGTVGKFKQFEIELIKNGASSELSVKIDVSSIYTANSMRDEAIKGEGFFEIEKYPDMLFFSDKIEPSDTGYVAFGKINMMGIEKEINVPFVFKGSAESEGKEIAIVEGNFTIDRTQFGMEHTASIGDEVSINFYSELKKD